MITSPLDLVPRAIQVCGLIESLMNLHAAVGEHDVHTAGVIALRIREVRVVGTAASQYPACVPGSIASSWE